jgi:hypothetical protein
LPNRPQCRARSARALVPDEVADFLSASFQGAMLVAKAEHSPAPIERFVRYVFSTVLAPGAST